MSKDWWPAPLAHIPAEDPWREDNVIIAEVASDKLPYPGERTMFGALVPIDQFDAVNAALANLDHYVSTDGPLPCYREDRPFNPNFWIAAKDLPADMYEPLVLSWSSHDTTVLQPDPRFLMTYGLVPRAINDGIVYWDDPRAPRREIVTVTAPFIRDFSGGTRTRAYVAISKDYLQDYLTLRHMALVQVFWETRRGQIDPEIEQRLNGRESVNIDFPDRRISLRRMTGRDECAFQVWGARHLAKPGALPITADPLDDEGLVWPGIRTPVTNIVARRLKSGDYVYVDDSVLASYEGRQEFRIHPPTGSVSHGNRWSVSYCDRVGRNLIRLEPRKLYECAPPAVVRHWNKFAVEPLRLDAYPAALNERNIAQRAKDVTYGVVRLGEALSKLALSLGLEVRPEEFVRLRRRMLEHAGWWSLDIAEAVSRHVPLELTTDAFLDRCMSLEKLIIESLNEGNLRRLLIFIGIAEGAINKLRGLKLPDRLVCLAQFSKTTRLTLTRDGLLLWDRLEENGTNPPEPV